MAKYIVAVVNTGYVERAVALIFPDTVSHDTFAARVCYDRHAIISAGFVALTGDDSLPRPYGESVSLKLKSRAEEDAQYLGEIFGMVDAVPAKIRREDENIVNRRRSDAYDHGETS